MNSVIPYTHWGYFPDEATTRSCATELHSKGFIVRFRGPWEEGDVPEWLLLAGKDVTIGTMVERHGEVRAVVERHGGSYDGGESAHLPTTTFAGPALLRIEEKPA
ncbi:ribonuclease E inhibitor RraB [Streptomyces sp. NPDC093269]|uniref:ribonuclease E inhibitor RraB n=1 Tax=Streptomyces sp. NPDC093269 TaxID=3366038 RepID=UPI00381C26BE